MEEQVKKEKKVLSLEEMEQRLEEKRLKQLERMKKIAKEEKKIIDFKFKELHSEVKEFIKRNKNDSSYKEKMQKVVDLLKSL